MRIEGWLIVCVHWAGPGVSRVHILSGGVCVGISGESGAQLTHPMQGLAGTTGRGGWNPSPLSSCLTAELGHLTSCPPALGLGLTPLAPLVPRPSDPDGLTTWVSSQALQ